MKSTFVKNYGETRQAGFTLVELLVSLALFSVVLTAAIGSLYTVNQASVRVNAMRTVLDNLNFATEAMSRTIRTGQNIVCGGVDNQTGAPNCPFGNSNGAGTAISLDSTIDGQTVEYRWRTDTTTGNGVIQKCTVENGSVSDDKCVALTAPEINVQRASFYVDGADATDTKQPGVMMMIEGTATAGPDNIEPFDIQTYVSQRAGE